MSSYTVFCMYNYEDCKVFELVLPKFFPNELRSELIILRNKIFVLNHISFCKARSCLRETGFQFCEALQLFRNILLF